MWGKILELTELDLFQQLEILLEKLNGKNPHLVYKIALHEEYKYLRCYMTMILHDCMIYHIMDHSSDQPYTFRLPWQLAPDSLVFVDSCSDTHTQMGLLVVPQSPWSPQELPRTSWPIQ